MTNRSDRPEELLNTLDKYLVEAFSRKAEEITVLDVRGRTSYADAIIIITARSQRQVSSIAENMHIAMKAIDNMAIGMEGLKQGTWSLLDYGDVIIHVFDKETRDLYDIEGMWSDVPRVDTSTYETERTQDDRD
ncbi:MAG: ribosome silencing factor [Desulfobacterium sp.]|nr:ribosome silencing factor [Desulfobacterium sp.]